MTDGLGCLNRPDYNLTTPSGEIFFEGPVESNYIRELEMCPQLDNFRQSVKQKESLMEIAELPEGMVFIARFADMIVGYVTFHYPDKYSRWSKHPRILELGAIETSRNWRKYKIAKNLLLSAFEYKKFEDYIVITIEFCWHWDLKNSKLNLWSYQKMLTRLFGYIGLKKCHTDDPDVTEHPANVLMVRFGANVSKEDKNLFESMTFQSRIYGL